ncbi:limonene-1,2-epoxide hydrolase family protein [Nocardia sp. NPDC052278]|uniref:limonene-1,2-epoxide hydrolase family protein n=1 Tax=unclassified Nocardia TaxID=2637762 RepID=UPI0036B779A7
MHRVAQADGGTVFAERTDRFLIGNTWVSLPVTGVLEVRDGKITHWRDYYDPRRFVHRCGPPRGRALSTPVVDDASSRFGRFGQHLRGHADQRRTPLGLRFRTRDHRPSA